MKVQSNILNRFPKHVFWDVDPEALDVNKDSKFIIPRALIATTPDTFDADIKRLEILYSKSKIIDTLKTTKERISNAVCHMVAARYHIPPFSRFSR